MFLFHLKMPISRELKPIVLAYNEDQTAIQFLDDVTKSVIAEFKIDAVTGDNDVVIPNMYNFGFEIVESDITNKVSHNWGVRL